MLNTTKASIHMVRRTTRLLTGYSLLPSSIRNDSRFL